MEQGMQSKRVAIDALRYTDEKSKSLNLLPLREKPKQSE